MLDDRAIAGALLYAIVGQYNLSITPMRYHRRNARVTGTNNLFCVTCIEPLHPSSITFFACSTVITLALAWALAHG
jgi:hypothetical protein